jgi:putative redox protein
VRTQRFSFPGHSGATLDARLELPEGAARGTALFAHCFTCGKDSLAASRVSRALAERGIATLRFDFTGLGGSEGDFGNTGFSSNVADLVAAADHLRAAGRPVGLLVGHSLGGAAVLAAAEKLPEARAVITIGTPFDPAHVLESFGSGFERIEREGRAEVTLGGRAFSVGRGFIEDLAEQHQAARIARLGRPLLVLHAPKDEVVEVSNARAIFDHAHHPKSFVALDGADHLLRRARDAEFVASLAAVWADRYAMPEAAAETAAEEGVVLVEPTGEGRFQQRIHFGPHTVITDEPLGIGGLGSGPTPYDLLLGALGACTAMTLKLYGERKGWPLEGLKVRLRHERVHAGDCADCETQDGHIEQITREIELDRELGQAEAARLLEIADKCPVHRTLHGEIKVRTRFGGAGEAK